ncbi:hypothetical protein GCM10010255_62630 [Streptomyces coeruleofuscus]|uniref:Resolvase/invertase-type recombinase catalytic domain-containing protein n=1 Tax=Streptomyces coeruleofuscus TaxID=66879 RepID=A0ABP5W1N3_9ACTN
MAELIRELIISGIRDGLDAARARGRVVGRPTVVNDDILRVARDLLPNPEHSPPRSPSSSVRPWPHYSHPRPLRAAG